MSDPRAERLPVGAAPTPPPPGWYPDPYIRNGQRYWDGYQWTSHAGAAPLAAAFAPASTASPAPIGRRDGVSVAAFVTAVGGVWPVSIGLGLGGLSRTRGGRRPGRRLAVAALIISAVWICALVTAGLVYAFDTGASSGSAASTHQESTQVELSDLRSGQCVDLPSYVPQSQDWLDVVTCSVPHNAEVYEVGDLPDGPYPGDSAVDDAVHRLCETALVMFSGSPNSRLDTYEIRPTQDTWDVQDRGYTCIAIDDDHDDTATMANTG